MIPSFLNVLFLAGLAGAALPLAIHLLSREKPKRVEFGWLRFVADAHHSQARRLRLRELLVLLMRMLLCALLALAFARPFFGGENVEATLVRLPNCAVVVVDVSYSMGEEGRWSAARERVGVILDELEPGDQVALLAVGAGVRTVVGRTDEFERVRAAVAALEPTYETTDLGTAFRAAEEMLRGISGADKVLYLVSDHQASGWQRLDRGDRAGAGIAVHLDVVGEGTRENLAVVDAGAREGSGGDTTAVVARVRHFGTVGQRGVIARLVLDEREVGSRKVDISAGGMVDVVFAVPAARGSRAGWVEVEGDRLAADNRRYFVLPPREQYRVLCVDGGSAKRGGATYFLERALYPWEEERGKVTRPRVIAPRDLGAAVLKGVDAVFLCDVAGLGSAARQALEGFVHQGGGLVVVAGERGYPALGELLPGRVTGVRRVDVEEGFAAFADLDYDHPLFVPFRTARHGDFGAVQTFAHAVLEEGEAAVVLMRFDDGSPALVEHRVGAGQVLVFATSFETGWTDLPRRALFPPFVHQLLRYLSGMEGEGGPTDFRVGERPDPDGSAAAVPGIYSVPSRLGTRPVAVNVDAREADLAVTDLEALREQLQPVTEAAPTAREQLQTRQAEEVEGEQRIWWFLMLGALGLAVGEMLLANRS